MSTDNLEEFYNTCISEPGGTPFAQIPPADQKALRSTLSYASWNLKQAASSFLAPMKRILSKAGIHIGPAPARSMPLLEEMMALMEGRQITRRVKYKHAGGPTTITFRWEPHECDLFLHATVDGEAVDHAGLYCTEEHSMVMNGRKCGFRADKLRAMRDMEDMFAEENLPRGIARVN